MKDPKKAAEKTLKSLMKSMPMILGVLMLVALIATLVPKYFYPKIFTKNIILDPLIGALFGGFSAGNPLTSYVIGGELLDRGVSLIAIVAFLVSWVTVGAIQFPAESEMLGKKFAIIRNLTSFALSIVIAIILVLLLGLL